MFNIRFNTLLLVSLIINSLPIFAGCPNGMCGRVQQQRNVRFASQQLSAGAHYRKSAPAQTPAQPVQAKQQNVEADIAKAQELSKKSYEQEQGKQMSELDAIERAKEISLSDQEDTDLEEAMIQNALANSILDQDSKSKTEKITQEVKKPTTLKVRIKNWFSSKWNTTKAGFIFTKDYVKNGFAKGWTKTKSGFSKLWSKIKPKSNKSTTATA